MASTVGTSSSATFELKGRMTPLTVLRLLASEPGALEAQLSAQVEQAPGMLRGLPVVLEPSAVDGAGAPPVPLSAWVDVVRRCGLVPVGVTGARAPASEAQGLGLGVFSDVGGARAEPARAAPSASAAPPASPEPAGGRVVDRAVRSGQQVYAQGGDLVVLAPVSPGAELLADGNIHVYGPLRGRALAGVQGNERARIFCQKLHAEIVAIAGWYKTSEEIGEGRLGRAAHIYLEDETVRVDPLER